MQNLFSSKNTRFVFLLTLILTALILAGCGASALGGGLSEQQAIDAFVEARGDSIDAASVKVNAMTKCDVSDESKVQFNIDAAWLVNYDFMSNVTSDQQNIALAVGLKENATKIVAQGMCP